MRICWDPKKAAANERKHGVRFSDLEEVFVDPYAIGSEDPDAINEQRFFVTGVDSVKRLLTVIYTFKLQSIRVISARMASRAEAKEYERRIRFK
jgi:uncharacterized DUF497 family protein